MGRLRHALARRDALLSAGRRNELRGDRESSLPGRRRDWLLVRIPAIVMTAKLRRGMTELGVPYVAGIQPQSLVCRRASGPGGPRLGHYL